jgi:hypothetical protein
MTCRYSMELRKRAFIRLIPGGFKTNVLVAQSDADMNGPAGMDDKYRVVAWECSTLDPSAKVDSKGVIQPSSDTRGGGLLISVDMFAEGILRSAKGIAFTTIEEAQTFAYGLVRSDPATRCQIVKGPVWVEKVYDREYWAHRDARQRFRQTIVLFAIGIAISSAILFFATPPFWASVSLSLCIALCAATWGPELEMQVLAPAVIAIISAAIYSAIN